MASRSMAPIRSFPFATQIGMDFGLTLLSAKVRWRRILFTVEQDGEDYLATCTVKVPGVNVAGGRGPTVGEALAACRAERTRLLVSTGVDPT